MGQPITVGDLRCGHGLHEALFNARYQKCMKFAIMFEASPRWGGTDEADMLEHLLPFWMEQYFKRENYLTIDNKPVLFVYQQERLQAECFQSAESQKKTFDACREYAKKFGFDGMIFAACNTSLDPAEHEDIISRGYDFRFGYNAGYNSPCDYYEDMDDIINQQCGLLKQRLATDNMRYIATASCFSDPTPRFSQHWLAMGYEFRKWNNIWYLPPERFRDLLREMKQISDSLPEGAWAKKIMMIDNWNEWDEGHFVAPSHRFGFQYLQAIREALTECDNLPDYRTPQDLGFTDLNQSWQIPDMTEPSKKYRENQTQPISRAFSQENVYKTGRIVEAYCGIGGISLMVSGLAKEVIGIEYVDEAVENASMNAKNNHIQNAHLKTAPFSFGALSISRRRRGYRDNITQKAVCFEGSKHTARSLSVTRAAPDATGGFAR